MHVKGVDCSLGNSMVTCSSKFSPELRMLYDGLTRDWLYLCFPLIQGYFLKHTLFRSTWDSRPQRLFLSDLSIMRNTHTYFFLVSVSVLSFGSVLSWM